MFQEVAFLTALQVVAGRKREDIVLIDCLLASARTLNCGKPKITLDFLAVRD